MGSNFCSRARSLEASCHSRVSVLGGGGATKKIKSMCTSRGEHKHPPRARTPHADQAGCGQQHLESLPRRTHRRPGSMRAKRDIVRRLFLVHGEGCPVAPLDLFEVVLEGGLVGLGEGRRCSGGRASRTRRWGAGGRLGRDAEDRRQEPLFEQLAPPRHLGDASG